MTTIDNIISFTGINNKFITEQCYKYSNYELVYLPGFIFATLGNQYGLKEIVNHSVYQIHNDIIPVLIKNGHSSIMKKLVNSGILHLTEELIICSVYCGRLRDIEWQIKKYNSCGQLLSNRIVHHVIKQLNAATFNMLKKYFYFDESALIFAFKFKNQYAINYLISCDTYKKTNSQLVNIISDNNFQKYYSYDNIQIINLCNMIDLKTHEIYEIMINKRDLKGMIHFYSIGFPLCTTLVDRAILLNSKDIFLWIMHKYHSYIFQSYLFVIAAGHACFDLIDEMFNCYNIIWDESSLIDLCSNKSTIENIKHILDHLYGDNKPIDQLLIASKKQHNFELEFLLNNDLI